MAVEESEGSKTYQYMILLLGFASLALAIGALYIVEILSLNYGAGFGAIVQSVADKTNVTRNLTLVVSQLSAIHSSISDTYLLAFISFGMMGAALVMYMTRYRRYGAMSRRYLLLHTALTLIYAAFLYITLSTFQQFSPTSPYFVGLYAALAWCLATDLFIEFSVHSRQRSVGLGRSGMRIEPGTPYTNMLNLRDTLFSRLHGDVKIVDKHFNSSAVSNLHRLLETNLTNIKKLDVLTSREMFDAKFNDNYTDFKNELRNAGVELNFMLMSDQDSVAQHERFIFDDERAYKIPPLNIINKKSEHIVTLRLGEARSRFDSLMKNATKYDNFVVKQARGPV